MSAKLFHSTPARRAYLIARLSANSDLAASVSPHLPTSALPGTPEKAAVMMARVAAGLCPCHPDDAKLEDADDLGMEETGEHDLNGADCKNCLDDPLRDRAADVTGKRVGDEREIRRRVLAALAARKAGGG